MVDVGALEEPEEIAAVGAMIERHYGYTKSGRARQVLDNWDRMVPKFVRVMPRDYNRMLAVHRARARAGPRPATTRSWSRSKRTPATWRGSGAN